MISVSYIPAIIFFIELASYSFSNYKLLIVKNETFQNHNRTDNLKKLKFYTKNIYITDFWRGKYHPGNGIYLDSELKVLQYSQSVSILNILKNHPLYKLSKFN
jgi:hypothetical protein